MSDYFNPLTAAYDAECALYRSEIATLRADLAACKETESDLRGALRADAGMEKHLAKLTADLAAARALLREIGDALHYDEIDVLDRRVLLFDERWNRVQARIAALLDAP